MLAGASRILKNDGRVVMIVPRFKTKNKTIDINMKKIAKQTGFKIYKKPILYKEDWHVIERLIYILTKKQI